MRTTPKIALLLLVGSLAGAAFVVGCAADDDSANLNPQPLPPGPEQPEEGKDKRGTADESNDPSAPPPQQAGGGTSGSSGAGASSSSSSGGSGTVPTGDAGGQ